MSERAPPHPPAAEWFAISFQGFANSFAARLGGPLYLVGSALVEHRPHDIDVPIVLEEADLLRLLGKSKERLDGQLWSDHQWRIARE